MIPTRGCALANLIAGEDPIGSATPFDQLFLLQVPPPWERIALDTPRVPAGVRQALVPALQAKQRAYALLVDGDAPLEDGIVRVLFYRRPREPIATYLRSEHRGARDDVAELIATLSERALEGRDDGFEREAGLARDAGSARAAVAAASGGERPRRDLLVCTHGERDGCCGTFGEAAYRHLKRTIDPAVARVWRVSHFGGHRFAPTLLDLPDGRIWGKLDADALAGIASRSPAMAGHRDHYRGWCALPPAAQIVERELFAERGWRWRDASVEVDMIETAGASRVRLRAQLPDAEEDVSVEADVREGPPVVVPLSCGADESVAPQYTLERVRRVREPRRPPVRLR